MVRRLNVTKGQTNWAANMQCPLYWQIVWNNTSQHILFWIYKTKNTLMDKHYILQREFENFEHFLNILLLASSLAVATKRYFFSLSLATPNATKFYIDVAASSYFWNANSGGSCRSFSRQIKDMSTSVWADGSVYSLSLALVAQSRYIEAKPCTKAP